MKHVNLRIYGDVQGIGFRWSIKKKADELGVCGFVRNEPDGTVYIEVEGASTIVQKFIDWLALSPGFANVKKITREESGVRNCSGFDILYA